MRARDAAGLRRWVAVAAAWLLVGCHGAALRGEGGQGGGERRLVRASEGLPEDPRERAWALLERAEGEAEGGRWGEALDSWAWAYEDGDEPTRRIARARAWARLRLAPAEALREGASDARPFVRGYAGAALLWRGLGGEEGGARWGEAQGSLLEVGDEGLAKELGARQAQGAGARPARVGVLLPLTGKDRRVGERALSGALVAEGVFEPGREAGATLVIEDTGSTPEGARAGVRALVDQGVSVVVGPLDGQEARAAGQEASALGVPLLALSADEGVVDEGPQVYRLFWDREAEVEALMEDAARAKVGRVGVLFPDAPVGRRLASAARAAGERLGVEVVEVGPYDPAAKDYSAQARELRRAGVGAVFIPDAAERVARILPFLATEGLWCSAGAGREDAVLCLGNSMWNEPRLTRDGGAYVEGARLAVGYTTLWPGALNQSFVRGWRASVGVEPPDLFGAYAFDAVVLGRGLSQLGGPKEAGEALGGLKQVEGLVGPFEVGPSRVWRRRPTRLGVKGGAFVILGEAEGR